MVDILNIIDYAITDGRKFNLVWGEDNYFARLILWLKCPGGSIENGFVCYRDIVVSGPEMAVAEWLNNLTKREEEAKERIFEMALPYIIDGCTEISNNFYGPWINLIPGETDERKASQEKKA